MASNFTQRAFVIGVGMTRFARCDSDAKDLARGACVVAMYARA